jgi:hypothetical protein
MSETGKTLTFGAVAVLLVVVALVSTPPKITPDDFLDQGEAFFPDFKDPNIATTLEVVEFDETDASAKPFKVTYKNGLWTIPSHHDYPADGKDRLAKTAAGVIGLTKDDFRSNNVSDHEACGVIDPLDDTNSSLKGRGKRITIKDADDRVLADLIFGKKLEDRPNLRFARIPGQKRIYVTKADIDISTNFADWIEPDLMKVDQDKIERIVIKDYSIDERALRINRRDTVVLTRLSGTWSANRMRSDQEIDSAKIDQLLREIDGLEIVGVRVKPGGLSAALKTDSDIPLTRENALALQQRGYYITRDGSLLSNEGELEVQTSRGVIYTLRFGEVLYGTGDAVSAGSESNLDKESGPGENRYLFITADFDPSVFKKEPPKPANLDFKSKQEKDWNEADRKNKELKDKHDAWQKEFDTGKALAEELKNRFADWYFIIAADSFDKIHLKRSDLVTNKKS